MFARLFIDTSAFIALYNSRDQWHHAAHTFQQSLANQAGQLITSNFVLSETYTLLLRRAGHHTAVNFGRRLQESKAVQIIRVSAEQEQRAWEIFVRYDDKQFSYVDCTSFAIMEAIETHIAFAFDEHFRQFGFMTVPQIAN